MITAMFYRFFKRESYAVIVARYHMAKKNAKATFSNSINRIFAVIKAMDNGKILIKQSEFWKDRVKARTGEMPKGIVPVPF